MLVTLIPLFDENMKVSAYSIFTQKKNFLLYPSLLGTGQNDNASRIEGLELLQTMGIETLHPARKVFVSVSNISIFSDIASQCDAPHKQVVLLFDNSIPPVDMYLKRLADLKAQGYRLAIRKLPVSSYQDYHEILSLVDYIFLDCERIEVNRANLFFQKLYPHVKLCASNIKSMEAFETLKRSKCCALYEGSFFRLPITRGNTAVTPLKVNYIELMNLVNSPDFDLPTAADIIGHDTALTISLLRMVNLMAMNSEITSLRHAAAMLGQRELKRWINTAVVNQLCSDKPNEIMRLSLLRAKFAENLAPAFSLAMKTSELFLMGLFSVLDIILDKPLQEALGMVKVSSEIYGALIWQEGTMAELLDFIKLYETADWPEISRLMMLKNISIDTVYDAYVDSLCWYRKLFTSM